ncbi:MAG: hypothetical protein HYV52_01375 [Parcubacteria group bacterium]|nr:hypothetical protein [Parcubacteria group bacterium]
MNYFKKLSLVVILSLSVLGTFVPYDVFLDLSKPLPQVSVEKNQANALATANGDGLITYGISANTTPQWRTYTASTNTFGAETATIAGATGLNFQTRTSPTKQEAIAGYVNSGGSLQIMCYNGTSWTNEWTATVGGTGTTRRFDIAYETNSGDVMVLYSTNAATTNELAYRTKLGSADCGTANWSAATNLDPIRTSGIVQWVKMAWDRRSASNLITAIWADANSDLSAMVWSGTAWGNEPTAVTEASLEFVAAAQDVDDFDVEYESLSGDVMVVWANSAGANGTNGVRYRTCTGGTSTCTWGAVTTPPTWLDDATNLDISANPNTDEMVFASIGNAGSDLQVGYWSGSAWTNVANADTASAAPLAGTRLVATGWLISGATTRGIVAYNDSATTTVNYRTLTAPSTWSATINFTPTPAFGNPRKWYDIKTDPFNKDSLILTVSDLNNDLFAKRLIMNATPTFTWTNADGGAALQLTLPQATAQPFSFDYWRFIPPLAPDATSYTNTETALNFSACATTGCGGRVSQAGDQTITVTGSNFGTDPGAGNRSTATNNIKIETFQIPDANVSAWSAASITFTIPTAVNVYGGTGASGLTITAGGLVDSTPLEFFVFPRITDTDAADGTVAGGQPPASDSQIGDIITIKGYSFGTGGTVKFAAINGIQTSAVGVCGGLAYNDTCIRVQIPGQIGSITPNIQITRTTPAKTSNNQSFTISGPTPSSANPNSGNTSESAKNVQIIGTGFDTDTGTRPTVCISAVGAANCTGAVSGTFATVDTAYQTMTYTFNLSGAVTEVKDILVINMDTQLGRCSSCFTVNAPGPGVTGISPASGFNDAAITGVAITGSSFDANSIISPSPRLLFGAASIIGTSCTLFSAASLTGCSFDLTQANLSGAASQAWDVVVANIDGNGTCSGCFTVNSVTPLSPTTLQQFASGGVLEILPPGEDTQGTTAVFTIQMAGGKTEINYYPEIELKPVGTPFDCVNTSPHPCVMSNGGIYAEGAGVIWNSGTVTGTITVTNLASGNKYHWQARVRNAAGANNLSNWVNYPDALSPNALQNSESESDLFAGTRNSKTVEYQIMQQAGDLSSFASAQFTVNLPEANSFVRTANIEISFKPNAAINLNVELRRGADATDVAGNVYVFTAGSVLTTKIYDASTPNLCPNCQTMMDLGVGPSASCAGASTCDYTLHITPDATISDLSAKLILTYAFTDPGAGAQQKTIKYLLHQATATSGSAEILGGTPGIVNNITISDTAPVYRSTFLEIKGVSYATSAGTQTISVAFGTAIADCSLASYSNYLIPIGTAPSQFKILFPITLSGTANYTLCLKGSGPAGSVFSLWNARLVATYNGSGAQMKTQEFFITQESSTLTDGTILNGGGGRTFDVFIGDQGIISVKSAFIEFTGEALTTTATGQIEMNAFLTGATPEPALESHAVNHGGISLTSPFNILHDFLSIMTGFPGTKNITTKFKPTGFDAKVLIGRAFVTHSTAAAGSGPPPTGEVVSSTFDTTLTGGGAMESILWKSATVQPLNTVVRFQIASSDTNTDWLESGCGAANTAPPSGCFSGPDGTPLTWYSGDPAYVSNLTNIPKNTPVKIRESHHKNRRYFRYKIQLCSNSDCATSGVDTPTVEDIIINWSK